MKYYQISLSLIESGFTSSLLDRCVHMPEYRIIIQQQKQHLSGINRVGENHILGGNKSLMDMRISIRPEKNGATWNPGTALMLGVGKEGAKPLIQAEMCQT